MVIYGVALLSFCMLVGVVAGELLGDLIGADANVGGVGIAMLLLIALSNLSGKSFHLSAPTQEGVGFWSAMYIPIVVAMAAQQDVVAAVSSGWMAIVAGIAAVAVSFAFIPLLDRWHVGARDDDQGGGPGGDRDAS